MAERRWIVPSVIAASVAIGGAAGAMIGGPDTSGAAVTVADTDTGPGSPGDPGARGRGADFAVRMHGPGPELEAAAEALGLSVDDLREKLSDGETTIADVAQEQGVDINAVIEAMVAADRERIEEMVNNPLRERGPDGPRLHIQFGRDLEAAAEALGISDDELRDALRDGKSIADIAAEKNVDVDAVIDAIVNAASEKLDEAVADGDLTQERADEIKADLRERITDMVNGELPKFRHGPFGGPRG